MASSRTLRSVGLHRETIENGQALESRIEEGKKGEGTEVKDGKADGEGSRNSQR